MELIFWIVLLKAVVRGVGCEGEEATPATTMSALTAFRNESGAGVGLELAQCSGSKIESILTRTHGPEGCQARPTVIPLPQPQAEFSHVIPSHYQVNRCSGSCINSHHTCVPTNTKLIKVPVMLSVKSETQGATPTVCAETQVEEHVTCECGCHVTEDVCKDNQFFLSSECRCTCKDSDGRDECLRKGWLWNQETCSCMCPNIPYPTCPSGYVFDKTTTCKCKVVSLGVSAFVEFVVVAVSILSLAIVFILLHCYKKKIGIFRERNSQNDDNLDDDPRLRTSSFMVHVRTLSDRLDSTASRIRIPSGNSVWDNGKTVKVVGISRIRSAAAGNRRHRGECCTAEAEELVQLNKAEEDMSGASGENSPSRTRESSAPRDIDTQPVAGATNTSTSPKGKKKKEVVLLDPKERKNSFLEDSDEGVKPYRTFTV